MYTLLKLIVFAATAWLVVPAQAQTVYVIAHVVRSGVDNPGYDTEFGTVSLKTGAFHMIAKGPELQFISGLGFGSNGKLYGLNQSGTENIYVLQLCLIDTATGALTVKKTFTNIYPVGASVDSRGVFTGLTLPTPLSTWRLFTLDPVTGAMRYGAHTTGEANGLVVADGQGTVYLGEKEMEGYGDNILVKVITHDTGAVVYVGRTYTDYIRTGFWRDGSVYTFGRRYREREMDDYDPLSIYKVSPATGAVKRVTSIVLPPISEINAAALAPVTESVSRASHLGQRGKPPHARPSDSPKAPRHI